MCGRQTKKGGKNILNFETALCFVSVNQGSPTECASGSLIDDGISVDRPRGKGKSEVVHLGISSSVLKIQKHTLSSTLTKSQINVLTIVHIISTWKKALTMNVCQAVSMVPIERLLAQHL